VKVPHHGSKTSSTEDFVRATAPQFAIISVGRHSMFGHPHKEVVQRWQSHGATVLTTGECGAITVTTDGRDLRLKRFIESQ
jgi:competence protein ComEC